jgi:hypothetical protein
VKVVVEEEEEEEERRRRRNISRSKKIENKFIILHG